MERLVYDIHWVLMIVQKKVWIIFEMLKKNSHYIIEKVSILSHKEIGLIYVKEIIFILDLNAVLSQANSGSAAKSNPWDRYLG